MLKGLLTRQIFMFADVALAVLTVFVAYQVFTKLFEPPATRVAQAGNTGEVAVPTLPTVGPRDNYTAIVASRLFGPAGESRVEAAAAPEPVQEDTPVTEFANLSLKGTSFTKVRPNALIEQQGTGAKVYQVGEEIIAGQVKLDEVHNRWVYLFNIGKNRREILRMDEEDEVMASNAMQEEGTGGRPRIAPPRNVDRPDPGRRNTTIKRDEIEQELQSMTENITDVIAQTNPRPVIDEKNGSVVGFTADNLNSIPLAKRLGFQDGDIVKEVNGTKIESLDSITQLINQSGQDLRNNTFRVTVLRNGTPTLLTFKLE